MVIKVYRYGLTRPGISKDDENLLWQAAKLIHSYDNEIIQLHNEYLKDFQDNEQKFYMSCQDKDKFNKIYSSLQDISEQIQNIIQKNKNLNFENNERFFSKELSNKIIELKKQRTDLYKDLDNLRKFYKKNEVLEDYRKKFFEKEKSLSKMMYAKYTELGMHWSIANDAYDRYQKSLKSLPLKVFSKLKFKRFEPSYLRFIIQCMSSSNNLFTINKLLSLSESQAPAYFDNLSNDQKDFLLGRNNSKFTNPFFLKLRINSKLTTQELKVPAIIAKGPNKGQQKINRKTKEPIYKTKKITKSLYLNLPINFHRPLPKDCIIKNIELVREVHGSKINYYVNFYVSYEEEIINNPNLPSAGMDIGFRKLDDNNLRLAAFADEKFNYNLLNLNIFAKNKVNDLKSIIDKEFLKFKEEIKSNFKLFASKHKLIEKYSEDSSNEEKILFKLSNLMKSKSPYKLYSTYKQLSNLINNKDNLQIKLFNILKKYAYHHHHLNTFKANTERKFILRRREQFRVLSKRLKDSYSKLYIEDIDLAKFAEKSEIVSKNELSNNSRNQRFDAGLSILRICLENKFGSNLIKVNPAYTSKIHNKCGNKIDLDNSTIEQKCTHCDELFDRDFNAALNILQKGKMSSASGVVPPRVQEALASLKVQSDRALTKVA